MARNVHKDSSLDLCQSFEAIDNCDVADDHRRSSDGYMELQRSKAQPHRTKPCCKLWKILVAVLVLGASVILGVLVGYYLNRYQNATESDKKCPSLRPPKTLNTLDPRVLSSLHENAMYSMSGERMANLLRNYTKQQVYSGTRSDEGLIQFVEGFFKQLALIDPKVREFNEIYKVTVSLPEQNRPNTVAVIRDGNVVKTEPNIEAYSNLTPGGQRLSSLEVTLPFVAYSPSGTAQSEVVYVNYGRREDFKYIQSQGIPLEGRIALIRIGRGYIQDKLQEAADHGVSGVLFYPDPADGVTTGVTLCSSDVLFLCANDKINGDPLTTGYPSTDGMMRSTAHETSIASIPSQPISCQMAEIIMKSGSGQRSPRSWRGQMNATYYIGRKSDKTPSVVVRLEVNNHKQQQSIRNVIGKIQGYQDPDHYVVVGAGRSSFGTGENSGVPGTAMLLELAQNLYILMEREQWLPKRTILLASWGGTEYGNLGITEFIQEYKEILRGKTVAYIDLDKPVKGNYSLDVTASSVIREVIYNAAQRVPSPDESQVMTYNTWVSRSDELSDDLQPEVTDPYEIMELGQSDPFYSELGVPVSHVQYAANRLNATILNLSINSLLDLLSKSGTKWEGKQHYRHYTTIGRIVSLVTLSLADAGFLQYDLQRSASCLLQQVTKLEVLLRTVSNDTTDAIKTAVRELMSAAAGMEHFIYSSAHYESAIQRRLINERLLTCQHYIITASSHLYTLSHHLKGEILFPEVTEDREGSTTYTTNGHNLLYSLSTREISLLLHGIRTARNVLRVQV